MINIDLLWMFLVPAFLSCLGIFIIPRLSGNWRGYDTKGACFVMGIAFLISVLVLSVMFWAGKGLKTDVSEIWNGEITANASTHGSYVESYSCNCRTVTSGSGKNQTSSTVCDTCYRDHYTVSWDCNSNIGNFNIDSKDWTSRSVYLVPDPQRFTIINKGDPVSDSHHYTNYIKAVPESLFQPAQESLKNQFVGMIPPYPGEIYDIYHVNRVVPVGVVIPNLNEWNDKLSNILKVLGPAKQANAVIVITKSADPNYFYALQNAWINGKKNDVVIVIGAPEYPKKAVWVNVMAFAQDAIFQVKMRDDILALDNLTADNVTQALLLETAKTFKRKHMKDMAYLDAEIDPPMWMMVLAMILIVAGYLFFTYQVYKESN